MLAIIIRILHLQAIVGQVHILVAHVRGVVETRSPNVACVAEEEVLIALSHCPHSDIEFATLVKERLLKILLNDPVRIAERRFQESNYLIKIVEYFDAFPLVFICWFYNPSIFLAMLGRDFFLENISFLSLQIRKPFDELMVLIGVQI